MRVRAGSSVAYLAAGHAREFSGWMQAGLTGIAYRLAHLSLPRPAVLGVLFLGFFLI
jgi:hypothetical protein